MKLKQSIQILLEYCGKYSRGAGVGVAPPITDTDRDLMTLAALRAFTYAYGRVPESSELRQLGFKVSYKLKGECNE